MNSCFDECAKILASDCSRRQMMGRMVGVLAGAFAGVFVSTAQVGADTFNNCRVYCVNQRFRLSSQYNQCMNVCSTCPSVSQLRNNGSSVGCIGCPAGQVNCGGACKNVSIDPQNCGQCGHVCAAGHACVSGVCAPGGTGAACAASTDCVSRVCMTGTCQAASCMDGVQNGNETDVDCGGGTCAPCGLGKRCLLGRDCASGTCTGGVCVCPIGQTACSGACVNTSTSVTNCGACGTVCSPSHMDTVTCTAGFCNGTCAAGFADCNNNKQIDGCEVNILTDPNNCGMCGRVCTMVTPTCMAGSCV